MEYLPNKLSRNGMNLEEEDYAKNNKDSAMSGDIVWVVSPSVLETEPTSDAWTRTVEISLKDSDGNLHDWFTSDLTSGISIADTSSAGEATIEGTTLSIEAGKAIVVVSGDAKAWLGGTAQVEGITCTTAVTTAGTITLTVTAADMDNSPVTVDVPVTTDMNTVTLVADAAVIALNNDLDVGGFFTASNEAGVVSLTAKTPSADDNTVDVTFADDSEATSVVFGSSTQTTAGIAKETDTLTVAQATILGYTVSAVTSVETFTEV